MQEYEDEDEDEEPSVRTRVSSLLLSLMLQLHHQLGKIRQQLQRATRMLGDAANAVRQPHCSVRSSTTTTTTSTLSLQYRLEPAEVSLQLSYRTWPPGGNVGSENIWSFSRRPAVLWGVLTGPSGGLHLALAPRSPLHVLCAGWSGSGSGAAH